MKLWLLPMNSLCSGLASEFSTSSTTRSMNRTSDSPPVSFTSLSSVSSGQLSSSSALDLENGGGSDDSRRSAHGFSSARRGSSGQSTHVASNDSRKPSCSRHIFRVAFFIRSVRSRNSFTCSAYCPSTVFKFNSDAILVKQEKKAERRREEMRKKLFFQKKIENRKSKGILMNLVLILMQILSPLANQSILGSVGK